MESLHFSKLIHLQAKKYGDRTALLTRVNLEDKWSTISWTQFEKQISTVSKAFLELGVQPQNSVGQFTQNKAENLIIDFALYNVRAIMVPMYATSTTQQVDFIVKDASIEIIFVGDQIQYDIALEVMQISKVLKKIIVIDDNVKISDAVNSMYYKDFLIVGENSTKQNEVSELQKQASEDDLACILYTSGTTGNPKGVMMPHSCFIEAMRIHNMRLTSVTDKDTSIAFLPLSHVFERTWCYFCLNQGVTIYINLRPLEIQQTIKDVRPTLMCAVPRFWEKVYAGVQENISKMSPAKMGLVTWAVAVGKKHNIDHLRLKLEPGLMLKIKYAIANKLILSKVKNTLGLENANILPVAGAKLSDDINKFMRSIGIPTFYGYGLTESTATVSCFSYDNYEFGTVGDIMPDVQVKIGEENEILLKGKTIFPGYYKNPEANEKAFTKDGWFRTGDAGMLKDNTITLTERIKDLFKTSNGKYIAPQAIETLLALDIYIDQIAAIGDERNFVTAIIAPSIVALEDYATKNGIAYENAEALINKKEIYDLIESRIKNLMSNMAPYEQIKKFTLIKKGFSIEAGELTNTLKMRRAVIMQKYKTIIDEMYA